jgi:hypothetical protein
MKKRIAETLNIRVNVGNYQHIELTKYAEKDIEYSDESDMKAQEDLMTDELLDNLIRNMKRIPERLGKKTDAVEKCIELVEGGIPKWLSEDPVPNIANKAKAINNSVLAENKSNADNIIAAKKEEDELFEDKKVPVTTTSTITDEDIFGDDENKEDDLDGLDGVGAGNSDGNDTKEDDDDDLFK